MYVQHSVPLAVVLVRVTIAVIEHQKQLGAERVYSLTLPYHSSSLREAKIGTHTGQEPGDRS